MSLFPAWSQVALGSHQGRETIRRSGAVAYPELSTLEQVFLIHKETGLLLQTSVAAESVPEQDGEMISRMLTAMQDFYAGFIGGRKVSRSTLWSMGIVPCGSSRAHQPFSQGWYGVTPHGNSRWSFRRRSKAFALGMREALGSFQGDASSFTRFVTIWNLLQSSFKAEGIRR